MSLLSILFLPHRGGEWVRSWMGVWLLAGSIHSSKTVYAALPAGSVHADLWSVSKLFHKQLSAFPYEAVLLRGFFFCSSRTLCLLFHLCLGDAAFRGAISKEYVHMETTPCSAHVPAGPYILMLLFFIKRQKSWVVRSLLYSCGYIPSQVIQSAHYR